ncbi:MAG TPA: Rrf2 family transcriptional regulator [Candidatus Sumerlaeota bacterium]|nr:Rrf2 family transcriptional regulator [Candidatus Sumerlaeota bacterium]
MKISTRMRYGSRAIVELARAYPDRPLSVGEMAKVHRLSLKYLEQIFGALRAAGLICSLRGIYGGYVLARPPAEISMLAVYEALEGSLTLVECSSESQRHCSSFLGACPTRGLWTEMSQALRGVLARTTLLDIVAQQAQEETASSGSPKNGGASEERMTSRSFSRACPGETGRGAKSPSDSPQG